MNYHDDNRTALVNVPQATHELAGRRGGYPAAQPGYPPAYPAPGRYPSAESEKNWVRESWRIVRRYKWVVLTTMTLIVMLVTIATMLTRPVFRATTKVEIGKETERVMSGPRIMEVETANVFNPLYLQTQIDILNSRDLARNAMQKLNLAAHEEFKAKSATPTTENEREVLLINNFQRRYDVSVGRQSRVVSLNFDAYSPQLAADVANAMADEYIDWSSQARVKSVDAAKGFLSKSVDEAKDEMRQSEEAFQQYAAEHKIVSLDEKSNITLERAGELNRQLVDVQNKRRAAEAMYQRSLEVAAPDELPAVLSDVTVQNLSKELSKQKQELANLSAKYQPSYPLVKQTQEQVKQLAEQLDEAKQQIVKKLETEFRVARAQEDSLVVAFSQSKGDAIQQNHEAIELNMLKYKRDTDRKIYEDLLQQLRRAGVESEFRPTNIRVVQRAEVPIAPVKPNKALNIGLSLIIGLALGIGLAFFLEYLNNTINTAEDVERIVSLPALGAIPSLQSLSKKKSLSYSYGSRRKEHSTALTLVSDNSHELVSNHDSVSSYAESYRALRTSLLLSSAEHAPRTMLITSSHPAEGKTTIVANTAISLAQTGSRVVVLDADMRRPRCHKVFDTKNDIGLSTYLSRDIPMEDVLQAHEIPNLAVITAGPVPPNPSELLSSVKLRILLAQLQERFDHIVIDSPPVIHVSDALIISPLVDGVAIVVKSGHTPREAVLRAKQALTDVNAKIFGVVLNCIDVGSEGYYYNYRYSYYHSYEESRR